MFDRLGTILLICAASTIVMTPPSNAQTPDEPRVVVEKRNRVEMTRTITLEAGSRDIQRLTVSNMVGDIELRADTNASSVRAEITFRGMGRSREQALAAFDDMTATLSPVAGEPGVIEAVGRHPERSDDRRQYSISWVITLPPHADLSVRNGVGDVDADAFRSAITLVSGVGDIEVRRHTGEARIETGVGDVDIDLSGPLTVEIGTGDADIKCDDTATVKTGVGEIDATLFGTPRAGSLTTGTGDVDLRIAFDPDTNGVIEASTGVGRIKVDNAVTRMGRVERRGEGSRWAPRVADSTTITIGNAGPRIAATTGVGDVTVSRHLSD